MAKLISIDEVDKLEEEYQEFYSHVVKYLHVPVSASDIIKNFYFTLRYLEGTVNAFDIIASVSRLPEEDISDIKNMVSGYIQSILNDINKY